MRPWKIVAISALAVSAGVVLFLVTMPIWGGWLLQRSMQETYDAISKITLPCEHGTAQVIEAWSKGGYSVSCRSNDVKDGPWQAWEGGHIAISGFYANGKTHGTWLVYTPDGKQIYRTIIYENGIELSNVVH